jgi:hypothetical protein
VLEHTGIGIAHGRRPLPDDATVMEYAERAATGERALQSTG